MVSLHTHIDGATQQRSSFQRLLDDLEQVGRGLFEVVVLCDAAGEVLEALSGGPARQCLVAAVHSAHKEHRMA